MYSLGIIISDIIIFIKIIFYSIFPKRKLDYDDLYSLLSGYSPTYKMKNGFFIFKGDINDYKLNIKNNKLHGLFTVVSKRGILREHSYFYEGKREGESKVYDKQGKLTDYSFLKNGNIVGYAFRYSQEYYYL